MNTKTIYELLSDDPAEFLKQEFKARLALALISLVKHEGWSQVVAAERLKISQPRVSNLFRGKFEKFSIDSIIEMLIRSGYKIESTLDTTDKESPITMKVKKAML